MIVHYPDIPVNSPQLLAFAAPRASVHAVRDAVRDVYERADGHALQTRWDRDIDGFRALAARTRWEVPSSTMRELMRSLLEACNLSETLDLPSFHAPREGDLDALRGACRTWASDAMGPVLVSPRRWLTFAPSALFRLRPFLRGTGIPPVNFEWGMWARQVAELGVSGPEDHEPDSQGELETRDLIAALAPYRSMRFYSPRRDPRTRKEIRGPEITAEELRHPFHDLVVLEDGRETSPCAVWDALSNRARLRSHLELAVGPYVPSRGPGPFLGLPDGAEPVVDPRWALLDVFRARDDVFRWHPPDWWVLEGGALARALEELPVEPRRWPTEVGDEHAGWGEADLAGWMTWEDARTTWWDRCRDRYRSLLQEAAHEGLCVVLTRWIPDDQGTNIAPSHDLGRPVLID